MYRLLSFIVLYSLLINANAFDYDISFLAEVKPKINERCFEDMAKGETVLRDFLIQAASVWNATTPGSMNGTHDFTGNYEGCLNPVSNGGPMQYCILDVAVTYEKETPQPCNLQSSIGRILCPHNGTTETDYILKWALCSSASCSKADVITMGKVLVQNSDIGTADLPFKISLPDNSCQTSMKPAFNIGAIIFFFIVGVMAATTVICTIWHWSQRRSQKRDVKVPALVRNWSVIENVSSMTQTFPNDITLFHCLRVMIMFWLINQHELLFTVIGPVANLKSMYYYSRIIANMRFDLLVDTYFAMGGFIAASNFLADNNTNIFKLALARYFRSVPTFALVMLYITSVMEHTGRGPFWPIIAGTERDSCIKHWDLNLLMLGNYGPWKEHCLLVSWYIPCDFHFYIVGALICRLIRKNAKMGVSVLSFLLVISIVYVALYIGYYNYMVAIPVINDYVRDIRSADLLQHIYTRSHIRISTYLMGVLGGYIAYVCAQNKIALSKRTTIIGFMLSITIGVLSIFSGLLYGSHSRVKAALYGSLLRPIWSFSFILFSFTFMFGKTHFPKLAAFFEMKMWIPLSQLTFSMYLTHMVFIYRTVGNQVEPFFLGDPAIVVRAMMDLTSTLVASFVLHLCVVNPSYHLFKLILDKHRNLTKAKTE